MRALIWTAVLCTLWGTGGALAQEKTEPAVEAKPAEATPTEAEPAEEPVAAEAGAATGAQSAEEPSAAEAPKAEEAAPPAAAEPARAERAEPEKAPAAKVAAQGPFQASWQEASPDEKALFLEAFGESSKLIQERWDKATPDERRKILRAHPLLGARPMKQRWVSATPEERAAFLEASPKTVQKVKEAWENATPEQRKMLALEHPYFARKAFHHAWTQTTPQEKIAFLVAHPQLHAELKTRWAGANGWQKQWYAKNYPGIESLANARHWAETTTEERALFLEANPGIEEKVRDAWQKAQPEMRATLVRRWQGWPLKAYQARLESTGKTLLSVKTRPAATTMKGPATTMKGPAKTRHP
jgi:hypothetical protein